MKHKKESGVSGETPKPERKLYSGKVSWQSTSFVGGLPISGTVDLGDSYTEEGVFYVVQQGHPSASRVDFSCEEAKD